MASLKSLFALVTRIGYVRVVAGFLIVVAAGAIIHSFVSKSASVEAPITRIRQVEVRSVAELAAQSSPLSIVGTVISKSEASVRAESSGRVTAIYRNLGDTVGAGAIVAELEDASQRAALLQAQGAEDAASAALEKAKNGTRTEQLDVLRSAFAGAQSGAVNAALTAYTAIDNAVRGTVDTYFSNPTSPTPQFKVTTSNTTFKHDAENERILLGVVLAREAARASTLSVTDDLDAELTRTTSELRQTRDFLDSVIGALNAGIATPDYSAATISGYITAASTQRGYVNAALSTIAGAKQALDTAQSNLDQGVTGAQPEDIAAAEAALTQTKGAVAAARANLERAIIRSPIYGTINSFSLQVGDYVSAGSSVLTVANNSALEVVAYMTENDVKEIAVGQKASLDSGASGVVTKIAPAIDPATKKIEVRIGVSDPKRTLVNGQSVLAEIERVHPALTPGASVTIPISAIKVQADTVSVFTVNPDSTLMMHDVTLGSLLGDRVEVTDGLTADMMIVTDARGLRDGQTVEVQGATAPSAAQ